LINTLKAMRPAAPGAAGGDSEGRKAARVSLGVIIMVRALVAGQLSPAFSVRVRDISATGISFVHERPIKQGSHIVFSLPSGLDAGPLHVLCEVRHCRLAADRVYIVGMCFLQLDYVLPAPASVVAAAPGPAGRRVGSPPTSAPNAKQSEIQRIRNAMLGQG
jgi:hypothetical protein